MSKASAIKDHVNPELYVQGLEKAIMLRGDLRDDLPLHLGGLPDTSEGGDTIEWGIPPYQTYPDSNPEHKLNYFRESPEVNSHHHYWHLRFNKDGITRHGEFFYFQHSQMLARYQIDRLCLGLPKLKELHVRDINKPIPLGYNSMMTIINF